MVNTIEADVLSPAVSADQPVRLLRYHILVFPQPRVIFALLVCLAHFLKDSLLQFIAEIGIIVLFFECLELFTQIC